MRPTQGYSLDWESPANFKGTLSDDREKSHICHSPSAAHIQTHTPTFTQAFREGSNVALWLLAHVTTSGSGVFVVADSNPMASVWGPVIHAPAASGCPQTNSQCILKSQVFSCWKSHKVPLASTSLWLLGRGKQSQTQHPSCVPAREGGRHLTPRCPSVAPVGMLQLFHTECTRPEPHRERRRERVG